MNSHVCILFSSTVMCGFYFSSTVTWLLLIGNNTNVISMWQSLSVTCSRSWFFQGTPVSSTNKTDRYETRCVRFHFNGNASYLPTFTLNANYIWAVLFKLHVTRSLILYCRSFFVLLYFFFWPLCCLFFFDIMILITPLVSSNHSYMIALHTMIEDNHMNG
jgi:hypothetical protein